MGIFDTDPLALGALAGLGITVVVTVVLFAFLMTRRDQPRAR